MWIKSILPTDFIEKIATGISEEDLELQIRNVENKDISYSNPENNASVHENESDPVIMPALDVTILN